MFDRVMSIPGVLIMLGLEDTKTVNMSLLHMILFKLCFEDSWCFVLNVLSSKYAKDLNVSGVSYTYEGF